MRQYYSMPDARKQETAFGEGYFMLDPGLRQDDKWAHLLIGIGMIYIFAGGESLFRISGLSVRGYWCFGIVFALVFSFYAER